MSRTILGRCLLLVALLLPAGALQAHPLRLSLCQIEYSSAERLLTVSLRLFLMDVNEALVFDPDNNELGLGQAHETDNAERLLLEYLDQFFYVKANGERLALKVASKRLGGQGDDTALGVTFEYREQARPRSLEIKNAVFTDLFFDQSNIIYVHVDDESRSIMLNKKTPTHELTF